MGQSIKHYDRSVQCGRVQLDRRPIDFANGRWHECHGQLEAEVEQVQGEPFDQLKWWKHKLLHAIVELGPRSTLSTKLNWIKPNKITTEFATCEWQIQRWFLLVKNWVVNLERRWRFVWASRTQPDGCWAVLESFGPAGRRRLNGLLLERKRGHAKTPIH